MTTPPPSPEPEGEGIRRHFRDEPFWTVKSLGITAIVAAILVGVIAFALGRMGRSDLQDTIASLQEQTNTLESANHQLTLKTTSLDVTNARLEAVVADLRKQTNDLTSEVRTTQTKRDESNKQVELLQADNAELRATVKSVKETNTALADQLAAMGDEKTNSSTRATSLQITNGELAKRVEELLIEKTNLLAQLAQATNAPAPPPTTPPATKPTVPVKGGNPVILVNQTSADVTLTMTGKGGSFSPEVEAGGTATLTAPPGAYRWSGGGQSGLLVVDQVPNHRYPGVDGIFSGRIIIKKP